MSRPNQSAAIAARWTVVFITLLLAISTIIGPSVSAEGTGEGDPPIESGEDTLGTPQPFVQPSDLGFFEMLGFFIEVIF